MIRRLTFICACALPLFSTPILAAYEYGIDVSKWQGTINWGQVHNAGVSFAFVKATEGVGYTDDKFSYNISNAPSTGILTGVYHMSTPTTDANDAINEANYFVSVAGDYMTEGYLRPVLDLERGKDMGQAALSQWIRDFMTEVERQTGVEPLIYCNTYYADNFFEDSIGDYDVWFARWTYDPNTLPTNLGVFDEWAFWQYSDSWSVDGISGAVDGDVCLNAAAYLIPPSNVAPVAQTDYYRVHISDTLSVSTPGVLINDTDADGDSLTASKVSSPSNGTLNFSSNGAFTYKPDTSFRGWDSFTYKASDGTDASNLATVAIQVYNNVPVVVDDTYALDRVPFFATDTTTGIMNNDNDADDDFLCVFVQDDVEHGTLNLNTNGSFTYIPEIGFSGSDQFTYYASDGWDTSVLATVTFQIQSYIIPGDANCDGVVDGSDVTILADNWQIQTGATWTMGDFNGDGAVDGSDVTILADNWQAGVTAAATSVPEPSTLVVLLGTLIGLPLIKRCR